MFVPEVEVSNDVMLVVIKGVVELEVNVVVSVNVVSAPLVLVPLVVVVVTVSM